MLNFNLLDEKGRKNIFICAIIVIANIINSFIDLPTSILFLIYALKCKKNEIKKGYYITYLFLFLAITHLVTVISLIGYAIQDSTVSGKNILLIIVYLALSLAFALNTYILSKGKKSNRLLCPTLTAALLTELITTVSAIILLFKDFVIVLLIFILLYVFYLVGRIALYGSLFLLFYQNPNIAASMQIGISQKTKAEASKTDTSDLTTDALALAKEKYELGILTQEEYEKQKHDILSRL